MNRNFNYFKSLIRFIHISSGNAANVHRAFRKVLKSDTTRKRKLNFQEFPVLPMRSDYKQVTEKAKVTPFRRVNVLNKLFMRYITDLIVNGEHWDKYHKLGIEITKVAISSDCKMLNIYWMNKKSENEGDIVKFLSENCFALRHELSQLKVIGVVPPIGFVKDKSSSNIVELEKRMEIADYGDDFEPLSVSRLKHQLELHCPLDENIKIQLKNLEENEEEEDIEIPDMPQNVLGLNHLEIKNRIFQPRKQLQTEYVSSDNANRSDRSSEISENSSPTGDEFRMFLLKRQILSQKIRKEEKNYIPDKEYIKEESNRSFEEHYENIQMSLDKLNDYIEDDSTER